MADTHHSDADFREHRETYETFLKITKWGLIGTVILLVIVVWALHRI